jgi:hypothetical protein
VRSNRRVGVWVQRQRTHDPVVTPEARVERIKEAIGRTVHSFSVPVLRQFSELLNAINDETDAQATRVLIASLVSKKEEAERKREQKLDERKNTREMMKRVRQQAKTAEQKAYAIAARDAKSAELRQKFTKMFAEQDARTWSKESPFL